MIFHIHHHYPRDEVPAWVCELKDRLDLILDHLEKKIMPTMQDIQDAAARNTTAEESIVTLLNGISQQLKDAQAANDPTAIQAVIDHIDANTKAMSDAVLANTPAAPAAPAS